MRLLSPPVSDAKYLSYGTKQIVKERLPDFFRFRKTSMINRVFISFSEVQIDDLSYIRLMFFTIYGYITNSQPDQLPVGLIAQLVEHRIGIAQVMASNPVQA